MYNEISGREKVFNKDSFEVLNENRFYRTARSSLSYEVKYELVGQVLSSTKGWKDGAEGERNLCASRKVCSDAPLAQARSLFHLAPPKHIKLHFGTFRMEGKLLQLFRQDTRA